MDDFDAFNNCGQYVLQRKAGTVCLDGEFSADELREIAAVLEKQASENVEQKG